jgi:hypothetical protein
MVLAFYFDTAAFSASENLDYFWSIVSRLDWKTRLVTSQFTSEYQFFPTIVEMAEYITFSRF